MPLTKSALMLSMKQLSFRELTTWRNHTETSSEVYKILDGNTSYWEKVNLTSFQPMNSCSKSSVPMALTSRNKQQSSRIETTIEPKSLKTWESKSTGTAWLQNKQKATETIQKSTPRKLPKSQKRKRNYQKISPRSNEFNLINIK